MNHPKEASVEREERIRRIENSSIPSPVGPGQTPVILNLRKLMEVYKVPGISVAIIDGFEIAWAKGFGLTETGGNNPVTPQRLFKSGSVSKPIAALGALSPIAVRRLKKLK